MTDTTLENIVVEVICDIGKLFGYSQIQVTKDTCPHKELSWFDSHLALLALVEIGKRAGRSLPEENIFVSRNGGRMLRIVEVAKNISQMSLAKV